MRFLLEDWNIEGCPKELARMKARESAAFSNQKTTTWLSGRNQKTIIQAELDLLLTWLQLWHGSEKRRKKPKNKKVKPHKDNKRQKRWSYGWNVASESLEINVTMSYPIDSFFHNTPNTGIFLFILIFLSLNFWNFWKVSMGRIMRNMFCIFKALAILSNLMMLILLWASCDTCINIETWNAFKK